MPSVKQITNKEIRRVIEKFINDCPDGTVLLTDSISVLLNARSRRFAFTSHRVAGLLRGYDELKHVSPGVWAVEKNSSLSLSLSLSQLSKLRSLLSDPHSSTEVIAK